jgi:hypothetical protein
MDLRDRFARALQRGELYTGSRPTPGRVAGDFEIVKRMHEKGTSFDEAVDAIAAESSTSNDEKQFYAACLRGELPYLLR